MNRDRLPGIRPACPHTAHSRQAGVNDHTRERWQQLMRKTAITIIILLFILPFGCIEKNKSKNLNELSFFEKVEKIPDSIKIDDIVIYNLFKYQILAHKDNSFDSTLIINKVYNVQPKIWKELYGVLFDPEMFTTTQGMVKWNREIFIKNRDSIESRVCTLLEIKFDSIILANAKGIEKLQGNHQET